MQSFVRLLMLPIQPLGFKIAKEECPTLTSSWLRCETLMCK